MPDARSAVTLWRRLSGAPIGAGPAGLPQGSVGLASPA
jgi:hypothetical protein